MNTPQELLDAYIRRVDARVGDGPYAEESQEIRRAVVMVEHLRRELALGDLLRNVNPDAGKPQVLLAFRSAEADTVLKVYGKRRPNEAAVQGLWAKAGVATAAVLASADEPVSWLLMPMVQGRVPSSADAPGLTGDVARIMQHAHSVYSAHVGVPKSLYQGIGPHLRAVLAAALRHGYDIPADLGAVAGRIYSAGTPKLLHGDLAGVNLLRAEDGRLCILDTCGYTGPAEFDAARWAARVGGSARAEVVLDEWMATEVGLVRGLARQLLGLELLMEAGVREIIKDEQGLPWRERDQESSACVDLGLRLAGIR